MSGPPRGPTQCSASSVSEKTRREEKESAKKFIDCHIVIFLVMSLMIVMLTVNVADVHGAGSV